MFISIDGANGVGKTTISKLVYQKLKQKGKKVFLTREPTDSKIGTFIRKLEGIKSYSGMPLAHLIMADRYKHIEEINNKVENDVIVITDRYISSSLVYQVFDGISINYILNMNLEIIKPDISFFITSDEKRVKQEVSKRKVLTRFEKEMTTKEEIQLFREAKIILEKNNYFCIEVNNEILDDSINFIVEQIEKYITNCRS